MTWRCVSLFHPSSRPHICLLCLSSLIFSLIFGSFTPAVPMQRSRIRRALTQPNSADQSEASTSCVRVTSWSGTGQGWFNSHHSDAKCGNGQLTEPPRRYPRDECIWVGILEMPYAEAPLGFARDLDDICALSFGGDPASDDLGILERIDLPPPPPLSEKGVIGRGMFIPEGMGTRRVMIWRALPSGVWFEERGLDKDLREGGLLLQTRGAVNRRDAVEIFHDGRDPSALVVCIYTAQCMIHRFLLKRPPLLQGRKALAFSSILGGRTTDLSRVVVSLASKESGSGPCCWIDKDLLVVARADGSLSCLRILQDDAGEATLSEEVLRAKGSWSLVPFAGGGGRSDASAVAVTGFWQPEGAVAEGSTSSSAIASRTPGHDPDLSQGLVVPGVEHGFIGHATRRRVAPSSRRSPVLPAAASLSGCEGCLLTDLAAPVSVLPSGVLQSAVVSPSGCFLSSLAGQDGPEEKLVIAAVSPEGGLPVHMMLALPYKGDGLELRALVDAPSDAGPIVDACVDDRMTMWMLWDRPAGVRDSESERVTGAITSYGGNGRLEAVKHLTVDEWSGSHEEEDGVFDHLLERYTWDRIGFAHFPEGSSGGLGLDKAGEREVAQAALQCLEAFYLRRIFTNMRFGRNTLASAVKSALPHMADAGSFSSYSVSLCQLEQLMLEGVRSASGQAIRAIDQAGGAGPRLSPVVQDALADVHGLWKRLLEACVQRGWRDATPLGLVPGGAEEFGVPMVVRGDRLSCLVPPTPSPGVQSGGSIPLRANKRVAKLQEIAGRVPGALESAAVEASTRMQGEGGRGAAQVGADKAAADLRAFDMRCALAREATAGGLEMGSGDAQASLQEEGGYVKEQQLFLSEMADRLLQSVAGTRLAAEAARELQMHPISDMRAWTESLKPNRERGYASSHAGVSEADGLSTSAVANMAAFGAIEHLKRRSDEARNTAIMLLVILEQIEKVGLATELRPSIMSESLPLVLKSMNQYALTAEVGSQRLRGRARRHRVPTATADPLVVTIRTLGLRGDDPNQRGNDERLSAAMQRADVPWGCTALGALFLDRREMRLDYPGMEVDGLGGLGGRRDLLGVLPCSLAQMCESTSTAFGVLDEAGLVEFLQSAQQCYLALPLVGQAVTWQWRLKQDPKVSVLKAVARGFLEAAEAEARERGGATSAAGSLLERAVCWYLKAAQPLRASILCEDLAGTEQRDGGRIRGGLASGRPPCGRDILLHLLESLQELDAVRSRLVRDAKEMDGDGAEGNGRGVDGGGYDHDGFGGRGAVNALKLARAALSTAREFESDLSQAGDFTTGTSTLCQLVFKHSSEAFLFEEAFEAICSNPVPEERKEDLVKLARRMCDNGCLGELCSLPLSTCPRGPDWDAMGVVEETLWLAAENTREADMVSVEGVPGEGLPGGAGSRAGKKTPVNYYDCLYALYVSRENFVQAALAQDQLKTRLERHDHGRTIAFVAAAQRARLAAMNALAVAPPGPLGGDVAALFPPLGERRLDDAGLPEDVKTAASLAREAAVPGPAVELAMAKAAVDDGDWTAGENGRTSRSSRPPRRIGNGTAGPARWNGLSSEDDTAAGDTEDRRRIVSVEVGSLTSEVVSALLEEGRYEDAADVALERWNDQPKNKYQEMEKVVTSLSRACAQAEALADKYARAPSPPLPVLVRGVGPMKPRVPTGGTTECRERAESLWLVLRQMLRLDSSDNNFGYHRVAAKALLDESSTYKLPEWLEDAFLGQTKTQDSPVDANAFPPPLGAPLVAPWKAAAPERGCGTRGANPTALLDLYVFAGRLEEGCLLLCRLLSVEKVLSEENGTDWLPYASIDRLFGLCEGSLTRRQKELSVEPDAKRALRSSLEEAYKAAKLRLTEYFKIAKHLAESARVYQASFSLSTSPSVFMMTD